MKEVRKDLYKYELINELGQIIGFDDFKEAKIYRQKNKKWRIEFKSDSNMIKDCLYKDEFKD